MSKDLINKISAMEKLLCNLKNHPFKNVKVGPQGPMGPQGIKGEDGLPGPIGPAGLTWRGAWNSNTSYVKDDAVGFGGASYFCISNTTGGDSPNLNTTNWALLAAQGASGAPGKQGPMGPQGPQGANAEPPFQNLNEVLLSGNTTSQIALFSSGNNQLAVQSTSVRVSNTSANDSATLGRGFVELRNTAGHATKVQATSATAARTVDFPNKSGTIALTSDIVIPTLNNVLDTGDTAIDKIIALESSGDNATILYPGTIIVSNNNTLRNTAIENTGIKYTVNNGGQKTLTVAPNVLMTANRTQTFQDKDGTIALLSDVNTNKEFAFRVRATSDNISLSTLKNTFGHTTVDTNERTPGFYNIHLVDLPFTMSTANSSKLQMEGFGIANTQGVDRKPIYNASGVIVGYYWLMVFGFDKLRLRVVNTSNVATELFTLVNSTDRFDFKVTLYS